MPVNQDQTKDFMGQLIGKVYDVITNNNPESMGPDNFIVFDPIGKMLTKDSFDFASKGVYGTPPKPNPVLDKDGKQVLDANGKPVYNMQEYNDIVFGSKSGAYAKMHQFALMTDVIHSGIPQLLPSGNGRVPAIFNPSANSVSDAYANLMNSCEVADSEIDAKVEEKLAKLRDKLFKEKVLKNPEFHKDEIQSESNPKQITQTFVSQMYKKYLEYASKYEEVVEANNAVYEAAENGDADALTKVNRSGTAMKRKEDMALKAWVSLGFKEAVEKINNYLEEVESKSILTIKKRLEKEFRSNKRNDGLTNTDYSVSIPVPAETLQLSDGWVLFDTSTVEKTSSYNKSAHKASLSAGFNVIFTAGKAGAKVDVEKLNKNFTMDDFKFSFRLGSVRIARPWLSQNFIQSKYWRLGAGSQMDLSKHIISDGNGKGLMPSIITELIMVKDMKFELKRESSNYKELKTHLEAGGGFRFGPFFNSEAKYSYDNTDKTTDDQWKNGKMESKDIRVIAYRCMMMPKAPNTDPSIKKFVSTKDS